MTIDGKVVAITGASSGIGLAAAALLAERGATLVRCTQRGQAQLGCGAADGVRCKGVLFGIAAALPVFRRQEFGHFINTASTAAFRVTPGQSVCAGTKMAVRAISEGLRQEAGEKLRVTVISPGMTSTNFADSVTDPATRAGLEQRRDEFSMPPAAVARAIAFPIAQPPDVDVGEIVVRPTAQA